MSRRNATREICSIAIFAAIISIMAQVSIPTPGGVPVSLQTLAIALAAIVLGTRYGTVAAVVYILLGAVGAPVFTRFGGGLSYLVGPTGGFILTFPLLTLCVGVGAKRGGVWRWVGLSVGVAVNYCGGMLMYTLVTGNGLTAAFMNCVAPFIPGDIAKIMVCGLFGTRLRAALTASRLLR